MRIIVKYKAGRDRGVNGPAAEFRHVVGSKTTEVLKSDALGEPCWIPTTGAPLDQATISEKITNALAETLALAPMHVGGSGIDSAGIDNFRAGTHFVRLGGQGSIRVDGRNLLIDLGTVA